MMKPIKNRPDFIAERRRRTMKKYVLLTTNHDSQNFLTILSNGSLSRFPLKNPRGFLIYILCEKTTVGSTWISIDEWSPLLNNKIIAGKGIFIGLWDSHKLSKMPISFAPNCYEVQHWDIPSDKVKKPPWHIY